MRKADLIIVFVPTDTSQPVQVLECALPDHLARARTVACDMVPQLVGLAGVAHICRVEDSIGFALRLVPAREPKAPDATEPEQPALVS